MSIKEYIDKQKKYNDYNINKDKCEDHNNNYEIYCFDCNNHLCKECLKSRNHINHHKINIAEKQPSKNEREIIQDSIKFYEEKIDNLEKEKLKKIKQIKNNYEKTKDRLNEMKELNMKKIENKMKKELVLIRDKFLFDKKMMGEHGIKSRKHKY